MSIVNFFPYLNVLLTFYLIVFCSCEIIVVQDARGTSSSNMHPISTISNDYQAYSYWEPTLEDTIYLASAGQSPGCESAEIPIPATMPNVRWFLLVHDGKCAVSIKAKNAAKMGYEGVIVFPFLSEPDPDAPHPRRLAEDASKELSANIVFVSHHAGKKLGTYSYDKNRDANFVLKFSAKTAYKEKHGLPPKRKTSSVPPRQGPAPVLVSTEGTWEVVSTVILTLILTFGTSIYFYRRKMTRPAKAEVETTAAPTVDEGTQRRRSVRDQQSSRRRKSRRRDINEARSSRQTPKLADTDSPKSGGHPSSSADTSQQREPTSWKSGLVTFKRLQAVYKEGSPRFPNVREEQLRDFMCGIELKGRNSVDTNRCKYIGFDHQRFTIPDANVMLKPKSLAKGAFVAIHEGNWRQLENNSETLVGVAVKINLPSEDGVKFNALLNEIKIHSLLSHDNIVKFCGACFDGFRRCEAALVMELLPPTHLSEKVKDGKFSSGRLGKWALDIVSALEYISSQSIVHRDIALRNVLTDEEGETAKLCDFGFAILLSPDAAEYRRPGEIISPAWSPPESLRDNVYSEKSDVWMFGVTMWELFSHGLLPSFAGQDALKNLSKFDVSEHLVHLGSGRRLPKPEEASDELYEVIRTCWATSKENRPPFVALRKWMERIL